MKFSRTVNAAVIATFLLVGGRVASSQETRATLTGHVADPTGAAIPGAKIAIKNQGTGIVTHAASNSAGDYTVPFLLPGTYQISVESTGFKAYVHSGIELQTEETVTENIKLAIGAETEVVTVEGNTPLIDTANASTGESLTAEEIEDLPSNGRSPLGFARDEYGAVSKGKHSQSQTRPFDNSAADDFSLGGGNSASNEILLNGVPDMQDSSRTAGFSPQLDSVDAVRVDEFSTDASTGDTSGGTVNITTKSGTNQFHGSISEYYEGSRPLSAKPYFTPAGTTVQSTHYNQFGGTIGGPVVIPHLLNGHNRLFFFYAFEGYIGTLPATTITGVPTAAERTGDFSALLALGPTYQLYNPNSTTYNAGSTTAYTRTAIPGNILSNVGLTINPIAAAYLKLFPLPNYNSASTKPDGENNYFVNDPTGNNYKSNAARIDYLVTQSNKLSAELHRSTSFTTQSNVLGNIGSGTTGQVLLWGGFIEDVQTFNPTTNLDARLGFSRSVNSSVPHSIGVDPTSIGFPSYISTNSTIRALPRLTFTESGNNTTGIPSISAAPGNTASFDTIQFYASLNKTLGRHNLKIGPDIRLNKDSVLAPGNADGTYSFSTAANDFVTSGNTGTIQPFGSDFALLELGLPSGGSFDVNTKFQYNNWYTGSFIQDNWKLLHNLTISLGLRVEHETPITESHNHTTIGWDPTIVNAASAAAKTAYTNAPIAGGLLPAANFVDTGGLRYATSGNRSAYQTATAYLGPRVGLAWSPDFTHGKTAIRLGFGIFENPFNDYYQSQTYGYSQTTNMTLTNNNNFSYATTLSDPFPTGTNPIQQPLGNALGINTNLGNKIVFYGQVKVAYSERTSLDIQQQFGKNWMLDVGAITNHQVHQSYSNAVNAGSGAVPVQYLSQSRYYDPALTAAYGASTPNPFKGQLIGPGATASLNTASTVGVSALLWPYAEYTSVTQQLIPGASANYNALLLRLEKRMSHGLQFDLNYTYSRNLGAQSQLDQGGPLWYGETASDFPHSLHLLTIYQLPFGHGRMFMSKAPRVVDEVLGGWEISSIWSFDSGTPYSWGNVIYNGNWHDINNNPHNAHGPAFNTSVFDTRTCTNPALPCNNTIGSPTFNPNVQPNAYNHRTFPLMAWRADVTDNWDFSALKSFTIFERLQIQARVDAFNAFNRAQFSAPNLSPTASAFGTISGQLNTNRQLQGGVHIIF